MDSFQDLQWLPETMANTESYIYYAFCYTKGSGRYIYSVDPRKRGDSHPGKDKQDDVCFHHDTQNGMQFKSYELFIYGMSHLIFSDCGYNCM